MLLKINETFDVYEVRDALLFVRSEQNAHNDGKQKDVNVDENVVWYRR